MPRSRTAPPQRCGSRGIPAADLDRLPVSDSSRYVPSTWQETVGPLPDGARARPMTSQSLIRMNQDVLRHTPQALAHSLSVPPAHACST